MLLLVLASLLAAARAECDACVDGRCYAKKTLARGLYTHDQLAIDGKNSILYVHTDSDINATFFSEDLKIQLVRRLNFTGLTVNQDTRSLYTGDNQSLYKYSQHTNTRTELSFSNHDAYSLPDSLFYKDCLTFTVKSKTGLYLIENDTMLQYHYLTDFKISDFAVKFGCSSALICFVANDTTYFYNGTKNYSVKVLEKKSFVLSTDKYNDVYFGDSTVNVIYKMDNETNQLIEYAAYESGSVDKFVFDDKNNIVSYDSSDGSFSLWKPDLFDTDECTIEAPHSKYRIKKSVVENNGFIR